MAKEHPSVYGNGATLDWTRGADPPTEYCRFIRNYDFASTTLGAIEKWHPILRQIACQIMVHPRPRVVAWGPEFCYLHNESARQLAIRHGRQNCLGQPAKLFWPEIMEAGLGAQYDEVVRTGRAINSPKLPLLLEGSATPSPATGEATFCSKTECYLDLTLSPIMDGDGKVIGILHEYVETTRSILADRRLVVIDQIEQGLYQNPPTCDIWTTIMSPLESLREDVPFAIAYSIIPDMLGQLPIQERLVFEEGVGVEIFHPVVNSLKQDGRILSLLNSAWNADIPTFTPGLPPRGRDELQDRRALKIAQSNLSSADMTSMSGQSALREHNDVLRSSVSNARGLDEPLYLKHPFTVLGRGFDAQVSSFLVIAIPRNNPPDPFGLLVLGMNTMRPYDSDYRCFINLLKSIIINNITSIVYPRQVRGITESLRREAKQHARVEILFKALGASAPFGLAFWTNTEGSIYTPTWSNAAWNSLFFINEGENPTVDMDRDKEALPLNDWEIRIHPDDHHILQANWQAIMHGTSIGHMQFRVLRKHYSKNDESGYRWILMHSSHYCHSDSGQHSLGAWAMDITIQKKNESYQAQRVEDALELKRQSEHFIDMVSHELRNPMSAMLQSSDIINSTVREVIGRQLARVDNVASAKLYTIVAARENPELLPSLCSTILDSSEVVSLCTQHQKRIVDDVLTLSKLDASLLVVVPERVHVPSLLQRLNHIYDAELKTAGIESRVHVDRCYEDMQLHEVMLDPGRLLQVLMNIFTNAQKFTRNARVKVIDFHLGASFTRPEVGPHDEGYIPFRNEGLLKNDERRADKNMMENTQNTIFLTFSVMDTGKGMSAKELKQLFKKFSQASPKTYGQYGGSGLGLFITRDLVELQGGQIGVSSIEDQGTTFFFYIKAERISTCRMDGSKLARKASLTELLGEFKQRKGALDRGTTELKDRKTATPSPKEEVKSGYMTGPASLRTPVYEFEATSTPGELLFRNGPTYVLLVEDNLINQRILAQQLRKEGCNVSTADNGLEAVQFLRQSTFARQPESWPAFEPEDKKTVTEGSIGANSPPDCSTGQLLFMIPKPLSVVLMDIEMPIMNGLEATRCIRDFEKDGTITRHVPIIAITANARPGHIQGAYEEGMDDVLIKPFRISELLDKIQENIGQLSGE